MLLNLASADAQQGDYVVAEKGLSEARKILNSHPASAAAKSGSAQILSIEGLMFMQQGKFDKAMTVFQTEQRARAAEHTDKICR